MYSAPITRLHPTAFIVLIDQSGSMREQLSFSGVSMPKSRAVSLVAGSFIDELLYRARREGGPRDYYDIAVLGYSGDGVSSLISPAGEFTSPSHLSSVGVPREQFSRERVLPSGRTVLSSSFHNVWIPPKAVGITPMCGALREGLSLVEWWCRRHRNSYPPTVINITDGEASDGDAASVSALAAQIRATATADGPTLFMNIHLARTGDGSSPVLFPSSLSQLPSHRYARLLWDISSDMPAACHDMIISMQPSPSPPPFRAVGWGSHIAGVAAMMNIGSVNSVVL